MGTSTLELRSSKILWKLETDYVEVRISLSFVFHFQDCIPFFQLEENAHLDHDGTRLYFVSIRNAFVDYHYVRLLFIMLITQASIIRSTPKMSTDEKETKYKICVHQRTSSSNDGIHLLHSIAAVYQHKSHDAENYNRSIFEPKSYDQFCTSKNE